MKASTLKGERIVLQQINTKKDALEWYEIMNDEQMHLWTGNTVSKDISETERLLSTYKNHEDLIAWTIERNDNNKMIGTYSIGVPHLQNNKKIITAEAQRIGREYWRKGYTREARELANDCQRFFEKK